MTEIVPEAWVPLFDGLDKGVLVMIGVIAFALERSRRVSDAASALISIGLGAVWGFVEGWDRAATTGAPLMTHLLKGLLMNGGGGYIVGRLTNIALTKFPIGGNA